MNTKVAITISLLAILCVGLTGQVFAQTRVPGVQPGDYFIYDSHSYWSSDNSSAVMPVGLEEANLTAQYKVSFSSVSGVNATATYLWDFDNGTQLPFLIAQDVESGQSYYLSYMAPPFEIAVAANLNQGDLLHPTGNDTVTINQTISRNYASGSRDTNVIELSYPIQNNETDTTIVGSSNTTFYIDKATGIIVEQDSTVQHTTNPAETVSVVWKLKETNVWDASTSFELTLPMIIAIVAAVAVIAVLVVVYVVRRRGHKGKSHR